MTKLFTHSTVEVITSLSRLSQTALVFDRLSPETRPRARDAALNYVNENLKADSRMGVYITGLSLDVYREGELAPGRYQMQTVVYDAFAKTENVQSVSRR